MTKGSRMWKWITAAALLIGFLVTFFLDWTGLEWHQWIGVALGALAAYHGWVHRTWVVSVARRLLGNTGGLGPLYFLIDAGLLAGFSVIVATGLVISSWLNLALTGYAAWLNVHVSAAVLTLVLVVVKVGTHWRWIVTTWRAEMAALAGPDPVAVVAAPVRSVRPSRREFLGLMGMVGAAALLASAQALSGVTSQASAAESAGTEVSVSTNGGTAAAATCTVQCDRRCSYPGHCRRYTDTNGNGRCDWGECA